MQFRYIFIAFFFYGANTYEFQPFPETTFLERRRCRGAVLSSKKEKKKGKRKAQAQANSATRRKGPRLPPRSAGWGNAVTRG